MGLNVVSRFEAGHRLSYIEFAQDSLGARRVPLSRGFFARDPLLFLMIEEWFGLFVLSCLVRTLFGRKTVGLLFRPAQALNGTSRRLKIKRGLLRVIKHLPSAQSLVITPYDISPEYESISDGWIYDFQFWDMTDVELENARSAAQSGPITELGRIAVEAAQGRKIVTGGQNRAKRFNVFVDTYLASPALRQAFLFVSAGKVASELQSQKNDFEQAGGVSIDRFISNDELFEIYGLSSAIWSNYAPEYNQASGIFGRALQLNKMPIVRPFSVIDQLASVLNVDKISVEENAIADALLGGKTRRQGQCGDHHGRPCTERHP